MNEIGYGEALGVLQGMLGKGVVVQIMDGGLRVATLDGVLTGATDEAPEMRKHHGADVPELVDRLLSEEIIVVRLGDREGPVYAQFDLPRLLFRSAHTDDDGSDLLISFVTHDLGITLWEAMPGGGDQVDP